MCSHVDVDVRAEPIVPSDSHVRCHRKFDDSNRQYPPITSEGQKWGVDVSGVPVHKRAGLHADPQHSARATGLEITHSCKVEGRGCENTRFRGAEYSAERWTRRQERLPLPEPHRPCGRIHAGGYGQVSPCLALAVTLETDMPQRSRY